MASRQRCFILIAIEIFSKWVEADAIVNPTTDRVISFVKKDIICHYGVPKTIQADNGTQFASTKFTCFCIAWGIDLKFTSVAHPQANGLTEVTNWTMVRVIKHRLGKAKGSWADKLMLVLWGYRTGYRTSTGYSPYSLVYGSEARLPIEADYPNICEYSYDPQDAADAYLTDLNLLDECREEAASNVDKQNNDLTYSYGARIISKAFKAGDFILSRAAVSTPSLTSGKLGPKWEGPYWVTSASASSAYTLETMDGVAVPHSWHPINLCHYKKA